MSFFNFRRPDKIFPFHLRRPFFSHKTGKNAPGTTAHPISSDLSCSIRSQHFGVFTPLLHCCTSEFTTTTAQLLFYNCKLPFTSAEIVISCTLKYALHVAYRHTLHWLPVARPGICELCRLVLVS